MKSYNFNGWGEVLNEEYNSLNEICSTLIPVYCRVIDRLPNPFGIKTKLTKKFTDVFTKYYGHEVTQIASKIGVSELDIILMNLSYEICNIGGYLEKVVPQFVMERACTTFGCTSLVLENMHGQLEHWRNLDWDEVVLKGKSIALHRKGEHGDFTCIGWPGFIGVVSGITKDRDQDNMFSITMNQLPHHGSLSIGKIPPTLIIRQCFEQCDGYDDALNFLKKSNPITSFGVTLCGPNGACIIEITPNCVEAEVRHIPFDAKRKTRSPIVQTNHFQSPDLEKLNKNTHPHFLDDSYDRHSKAMSEAKRCNEIRWAGRNGINSVSNDSTIQQMKFIPATGEWCCY